MGARAHMSPAAAADPPEHARVRLHRPARARLAGRGLPGRPHHRAEPDHPHRAGSRRSRCRSTRQAAGRALSQRAPGQRVVSVASQRRGGGRRGERCPPDASPTGADADRARARANESPATSASRDARSRRRGLTAAASVGGCAPVQPTGPRAGQPFETSGRRASAIERRRSARRHDEQGVAYRRSAPTGRRRSAPTSPRRRRPRRACAPAPASLTGGRGADRAPRPGAQHVTRGSRASATCRSCTYARHRRSRRSDAEALAVEAAREPAGRALRRCASRRAPGRPARVGAAARVRRMRASRRLTASSAADAARPRARTPATGARAA